MVLSPICIILELLLEHVRPMKQKKAARPPGSSRRSDSIAKNNTYLAGLLFYLCYISFSDTGSDCIFWGGSIDITSW